LLPASLTVDIFFSAEVYVMRIRALRDGIVTKLG
jgi:hypothetical protein